MGAQPCSHYLLFDDDICKRERRIWRAARSDAAATATAALVGLLAFGKRLLSSIRWRRCINAVHLVSSMGGGTFVIAHNQEKTLLDAWLWINQGQRGSGGSKATLSAPGRLACLRQRRRAVELAHQMLAMPRLAPWAVCSAARQLKQHSRISASCRGDAGADWLLCRSMPAALAAPQEADAHKPEQDTHPHHGDSGNSTSAQCSRFPTRERRGLRLRNRRHAAAGWRLVAGRSLHLRAQPMRWRRARWGKKRAHDFHDCEWRKHALSCARRHRGCDRCCAHCDEVGRRCGSPTASSAHCAVSAARHVKEDVKVDADGGGRHTRDHHGHAARRDVERAHDPRDKMGAQLLARGAASRPAFDRAAQLERGAHTDARPRGRQKGWRAGRQWAWRWLARRRAGR